MGIYYARDVLGSANYYIILTLVQTVGIILASGVVPKLVERDGWVRSVRIGAGVLSAAAVIGLAVARGSVAATGT